VGAFEVAMAAQIDRDKLRMAIRTLGDEYIFYIHCNYQRAEMLTEARNLGTPAQARALPAA